MKGTVHGRDSSQPGLRILAANALKKQKSPRCLGRMLTAACCPESGAFVGLAHPAGFEPTAYRLGVPYFTGFLTFLCVRIFLQNTPAIPG